ncbi:hypothetical protein [Ligilactobacillus apodemi]|uniref:Uncharacterized protein n=1 Tax=Ligilactobacillus apodemi DSM 16634 = JCM 16172 TaxID=1423724 RepID=A0A0R1TTI0_9LACO|nr:hypothetical protein [Ligilactobacillus apodemi]KRL84609.1 hypothetical protein FC32_GL000506 [Ligilactobacillus apodemi DSM 16634 = JCM 16172]
MVVKYDDDTPITKRLRTMAEIVEAIRHKKNGKDVRESIAQLGEYVVATISEIEHLKSAKDNKDELKNFVTKQDLDVLDKKIKRIILGIDHDTIKLVVREILKEEGVI